MGVVVTPSLCALGVDPGSLDGAAVLLAGDGDTVLEYWAWTQLKRKGQRPVFRVTYTNYVFEERVLWEVAAEIATHVDPCQLVIEGLYVPSNEERKKRGQKRQNIQDLQALIESVGEFRAGLGWDSPIPELRPPARVWRPETAGIPAGTPRKKAKALAITQARLLLTWPEHTTTLTRTEQATVAEAALIARHGVRQRKFHPKLREFFVPEKARA